MTQQGWASSAVVDRVREGRDELEQKAQEETEMIQHEMKVIALNPFVSVLFKPRSTLSEVYALKYPAYWPVLLILLAAGMGKLSLIIAAGGGASGFFQQFSISLFATFLGLVLTHFAAKMLSGSANIMRSVVAWGWSSVPMVISGLVSLFVFFFVGDRAFDVSAKVGNSMIAPQYEVLISIAFITFTLMSIWSIALTVVAVSEAQKISKWKSFFALLIGVGSLYVCAIVLAS